MQLMRARCDFVVGDRELAIVYHNEINNLPADDRRRLRRKQRLYLEEWVHLVDELHAGQTDSDARALVHAAIGAIQSTLFHTSGLPGERLRELLTGSAVAILGGAELTARHCRNTVSSTAFTITTAPKMMAIVAAPAVISASPHA